MTDDAHHLISQEHPMPDHGSGPLDDAEWDARYAEADRVWSGNPNGTLVTEVADLAPGRALDVGCGEGADAVWLARAGWDVTALDVSQIALDRTATHAADAGVTLRFVHAGLIEARLPAGSFDLVSAQYPALRKTPGSDAERALIEAVAPGGVLLVVHHAPADAEHEGATGFNPDDYVAPADVRALLGESWQVEIDEVRPRHVTSGAGAHHVGDVVLRARRVS